MGTISSRPIDVGQHNIRVEGKLLSALQEQLMLILH
jgi:hypothetical protein